MPQEVLEPPCSAGHEGEIDHGPTLMYALRSGDHAVRSKNVHVLDVFGRQNLLNTDLIDEVFAF
jgi:hypothetical protein